MRQDTASGRWSELDGQRQGFITRCEKYSAFTIPKICPINGYDQDSDELSHDYQSLGAQAVNHLSNKIMLALFAPSRPFFRLDASDKMLASLAEMNMTQDDLNSQLSMAEQKAVRELDRRSIRPKMYDGIKHIIVTGNGLLIMGKDNLRVLGLKNYVVKRDTNAEVLELITKETVDRMALEPGVVEALGDKLKCDALDQVELYKWIKRREDGDYEMTQWVNEDKLPDRFDGKWPLEKLPYRAITWDLASGDDYGTGLVEDYSGDFAALSILSKATVQAAILASEFRWLVNPAGMTQPEDLENSENGAALAGVAGDINLVQSGKAADLQVNINIAQVYINRIGSGFLLQSAVTRQAERVTAEEIRRTAEELENSLGGAYSRIAVDIQLPMSYWLMDMSGRKIAGTDIEPTIVTGLAALSRSGDRDNLVLFLQDMATFMTVPPELRARMRVDAIQSAFASARGLSPSAYLLTEAEFQKQQQAQLAQQLEVDAAQAGTQAAAQQIVQQE
jgi:hypothetical protein